MKRTGHFLFERSFPRQTLNSGLQSNLYPVIGLHKTSDWHWICFKLGISSLQILLPRPSFDNIFDILSLDQDVLVLYRSHPQNSNLLISWFLRFSIIFPVLPAGLRLRYIKYRYNYLFIQLFIYHLRHCFSVSWSLWFSIIYPPCASEAGITGRLLPPIICYCHSLMIICYSDYCYCQLFVVANYLLLTINIAEYLLLPIICYIWSFIADYLLLLIICCCHSLMMPLLILVKMRVTVVIVNEACDHAFGRLKETADCLNISFQAIECYWA